MALARAALQCGRHPAPAAQHLIGVLPQGWRRIAQHGRCADRRSGLATPVMCVMPSPASPSFQRGNDTPGRVPDLCVVKRLGNGVDGAAGHGLVFQQNDPIGRGARSGHSLHGGNELLRGASHAACWWQSVRRWPTGAAWPLRKALELPSLPMASSMLPSCVGEVLVGRQAGVAVAHAAGARPLWPKACGLVGQHGHAHVQQGHVDVLAWPVWWRGVQRRQMALLAYRPVNGR